MKVKVVVPYYDEEMDKWFMCGEILNVDGRDTSDFYHIWKGNKLYIIPKNCCEKI